MLFIFILFGSTVIPGAVHILPHHGPGGVGVRENMMKYDGFARGGGGMMIEYNLPRLL